MCSCPVVILYFQAIGSLRVLPDPHAVSLSAYYIPPGHPGLERTHEDWENNVHFLGLPHAFHGACILNSHLTCKFYWSFSKPSEAIGLVNVRMT